MKEMTLEDWFNVINAHLKWKLRLKKLLDGTSSENFDTSTICKDDKCDLGKWIYSVQKEYKDDKAFLYMKRVHADFHKCAADIINLYDTDKKKAEEKFHDAMNLSGYARCSNRTISAIGSFSWKIKNK